MFNLITALFNIFTYKFKQKAFNREDTELIFIISTSVN